MCIRMYVNVCAEEPQNLSNRSSPTAVEMLGKGRGEEDQFVFIGPLFLFSVLRRPSLRTPSALGVSFTAKPLRAKLVNSSVTIPTGWILRRRLCHRNGQLLTESDHLFALGFLIVECHFRLNFADDKSKDIQDKGYK